MAPTNRYGFRIYTFSIGRKNSWRNPDSLSDLGDDFVARVDGLLTGAIDQILKYTPDLAAGDGSVRVPKLTTGEPVLVIRSVERDGQRIRCGVVAGMLGDHDDLVGDNVEQIGDRAAGRRYFVDLYFPVAGDLGMVVAETCKRYTPVDLLIRWLAWLDLLSTVEALARIDQQTKDGKITAEEASKQSAQLAWRKMRISQVSDAEYLRTLIGQAKKVSVDLVQAGGVTRRGRFRQVERKLSVLDVGEGVHDALADEIMSWLGETKAKGAIGRVMDLLGLDPTRLAADGLGFNNTSVQLTASQTVSVTPDSVKDLFTYPLSDSLRLDDADTWEFRTRPKLVELAVLERVELDV